MLLIGGKETEAIASGIFRGIHGQVGASYKVFSLGGWRGDCYADARGDVYCIIRQEFYRLRSLHVRRWSRLAE